MLNNGKFTKNVGILGSTGGGKNWRGMYVILYNYQKFSSAIQPQLCTIGICNLVIYTLIKPVRFLLMKLLHRIVVMNWGY